MLKTDPPEVSVLFYSSCISEDAWVGHGGRDGGDTRLHREVVVPRWSIVVLQARCENRIIEILWGEKKSFSHLPLKRYDLTLKFFYLDDSMM